MATEHIARVVQRASRRRGPYGGIHYYAECSCESHGSPRDDRASAERDAFAHVRRETQAAFVAAWRAEHAVDLLDEGWRCPLCREVIQATDVACAVTGITREQMISEHQHFHDAWNGGSWLDYLAAGQVAEREGAEG